MATPRGRILKAVRPVFTASGKEVLGRKPLLVCYVKTGSRRMRDQFDQSDRRLGLEVRPVQDVFVPEVNGQHGYLTAYEVVGTPQALEEFTAKACVLDWQYPLDVAVPRNGSRSGDKPRRQLHPLTQRLIQSVKQQHTIDENRVKPKP